MSEAARNPEVSAIVLNFNGKRYLDPCFQSLLRLRTAGVELVLVDNASQDGSAAHVEAAYPSVRVLRNEQNLGYAAANNRAARFARGRNLLFLNNDTTIHPEAVAHLVRAANEHPSAGVFACRQRTYDDAQDLNCGMSADLFADPYPPLDGRILYADGASLFVRRPVFESLGGFDEAYFLFNEDLDFGWRARLAGHDVLAVPEAIVYHVGGGTVEGSVRKTARYETTFMRRYLGERNSLRTMLKNYRAVTLVLLLPLRIAQSVAESLFFLILGRPRVAAINLRAMGWNLRHLRSTLAERRRVQALRVVGDRAVARLMRKRSSKLTVFARYGLPSFR